MASVEREESVEPVGSAEREALAESVELVAGIAHPPCPRVVANAATGNIIQHTAVELLIETERPRTDLEAPLAATPSATGRPTLGNRLVVRAEISRATEAAAEGRLPATGLAAQAPATELAEAVEIVSAGGISPAAGAETGMLSEEVLRAIADQAPALIAVAARPAWDLEAEAEGVAAAAVGEAGR